MSYKLKNIEPNFGDAPNDFVWDPLNIMIPDGFAFLGIGSLLCEHFFNTCTNEDQDVLCVGGGAGLGVAPTAKSLARTKFLFVRGPYFVRSV